MGRLLVKNIFPGGQPRMLVPRSLGHFESHFRNKPSLTLMPRKIRYKVKRRDLWVRSMAIFV